MRRWRKPIASNRGRANEPVATVMLPAEYKENSWNHQKEEGPLLKQCHCFFSSSVPKLFLLLVSRPTLEECAPALDIYGANQACCCLLPVVHVMYV